MTKYVRVGDSCRLELNAPGGISGPTSNAIKRYRCSDCKEHFNTPAQRKAKNSRNSGRSGLTKKLMDANPEDWP